MDSLPDDILADILSRIPVKNILQSKCVCKLWCTLISHQNFANLQLKQSYPGNNQKNGNNRILVFLFSEDSPRFLDYDENPETAATTEFAASKLDFPLKNDKCYQEIYGFCNGILCVQLEREIVIWNPSIKQHKILPKDDDGIIKQHKILPKDDDDDDDDDGIIKQHKLLPKDDGDDDYGIMMGFGYDSVHDDYKVVKASVKHRKVFSLKRNSWRRIEDDKYEYVHHHWSNFLNGSLHWLARKNDPQNPSNPSNPSRQEYYNHTAFVAFSLAEEKFVAEVPQPNVRGKNVGGMFEEMNVFDGCLCLYRFNQKVGLGTGFEIWVMKEYMVRASWTKLCTVLWETIPRKFRGFSRPISYSQDGDILLEIGLCGVVKYNMKEKICTSTVFRIKHDAHLSALAFVESLVSPNYDDL